MNKRIEQSIKENKELKIKEEMEIAEKMKEYDSKMDGVEKRNQWILERKKNRMEGVNRRKQDKVERIKKIREEEMIEGIMRIREKEKKARRKIEGKNEVIEMIKTRYKSGNKEKARVVEMKKREMIERQIKAIDELREFVEKKIRKKENSQKQNEIKAKLAKEINLLRKREQELNLKML